MSKSAVFAIFLAWAMPSIAQMPPVLLNDSAEQKLESLLQCQPGPTPSKQEIERLLGAAGLKKTSGDVFVPAEKPVKVFGSTVLWASGDAEHLLVAFKDHKANYFYKALKVKKDTTSRKGRTLYVFNEPDGGELEFSAAVKCGFR